MKAGRMRHRDHMGNEGLIGAAGAKALVLSGRPLKEPIVQYGPFVMNSAEEIEQAFKDYRSNQLAI